MGLWQRILLVALTALVLTGCAANLEQIQQSGNAAFDNTDYQAAVGFYRKALEKAPGDAGLWNQLGRAQLRLGNEDEAGKAFTKSLEIRPDAGVWSNLGLTSYRQGNYAEAAAAYERALEIKPTARWWHQLGESRDQQKQYAKAVTAYTRALAIKPDREQTVYKRGWAHYRNNDYNKAIVDFDRLVRSKEYGENALNARGWSYYRKGMYTDAHRDFTAALRINPRRDSSLRGRGWSLYFSGQFKAAIKDFTEAIENTQPKRKKWIRNTLHGKALAYLGVGDPQTATRLIEKAHATAPLDAWTRIVFYYLSGDRQKAWQLRGGEGLIGVEVRDYHTEIASGAELLGFTTDSAAARAGFLEGDVIVAVNGTRVNGMVEAVEAIAALQPGSLGKIVVLREDWEKTIVVRIGSAATLIRADQFAIPLLHQTANMGADMPAAKEPTPVPGQKSQKTPAADELF